MHRVAIIGGGFGGLYAARCLRRAPVAVTLLDRRNYHLFQPLLYQVATGTLSPANIASPLRSLLKRQQNTTVLLAEAREIDVTARRVEIDSGAVDYDSLIVAAGSTHSYFGHDDWERLAPSLKSIDDATEIRRKILLAFETAERATDEAERRKWMTFVVVGGGPTGVELAGQLAEIAEHTLPGEFRRIRPQDAQVYLVETAGRMLGSYPAKLSGKAEKALEDLGIKLLKGAMVTDIRAECVEYRQGERRECLECRTVLWAAGVRASPLAEQLATATGAKTDRSGRICVSPRLSLPGHDEIFVIGDMACCEPAPGEPLPALAQVAMQQGRYAAQAIETQLQGRKDERPFRYRDYGTLATIGRNQAVADLHVIWLWGFAAWAVWLVVHLMSLVQFQNRLLVMMQWGWSYLTRNRAARLITGGIQLPPGTDHAGADAAEAMARSEK
ncbi:MAG TPA: NAD(P)/FAD-dependent oxidoreductase [Pirellulales bacterium]|jgi:NADH dehydrogenase|nr:NAD(P)/FAD-dependent oxidoreductase [Pirellulales bacterium]